MTEWTLTATEIACGVTEAEARRVACSGLTTSDGVHVAFHPDTPPAVGFAAARLRLGGPVEFLWLNFARMPVYALR